MSVKLGDIFEIKEKDISLIRDGDKACYIKICPGLYKVCQIRKDFIIKGYNLDEPLLIMAVNLCGERNVVLINEAFVELNKTDKINRKKLLVNKFELLDMD